MPSGGHPLAVIGGKWKAVLIFHMMHSGTHRFAELRRKTRGISERVLSRQLRELESDGIGWWGLVISLVLGLAGGMGQLVVFWRPPAKTG